MTDQQDNFGSDAVQAIRTFFATYDDRETVRQALTLIRTRLLYHREREHYPEWVDHGGEA